MSAVAYGGAVQVDPMKPMLKAPRSERLKLNCDDLAFKFCFQFQLAPLQYGCVPVIIHDHTHMPFDELLDWDSFAVFVHKVGRCRLTL